MRSLLRRYAPAVVSAALGTAACGEAFTSGGGTGGSGGGDASIPGEGGTSASGGGGAVASGGTAPGGGTGAGGKSASGGAGAGGARAGAGGSGGKGAGGNVTDAGSGGKGAGGAPPSGGGASSGGQNGTGGGPPEIPTDGLVLWLRANAGITANGGVVSVWADQSPSHTDATQELARAQPVLVADGINGHPAVLFDGADDFLQIGKGFLADTGNVTIFTIAQATTTDSCMAIFEASNGPEIDDISLGCDYGKLNYEIYNSNNEDIVFYEGVPQIFGVTHADTDPDSGDQDPVMFFRNGFFETMASIPAPVKLRRDAAFVGKTLYGGCATYAGRVGELIVYDRAFSTEEMKAVETYLQREFGCCTKL